MPERYYLTFTERMRSGRTHQVPVYFEREGDKWRQYERGGRRRKVYTISDAQLEHYVDNAKREGRFMRHERSNPRRRPKEQTGFDVWQPDLFGGAHKERGEGRTREEQLRLARAEMRDTGSRSLFDFLAGEGEPKKNPGSSLAVLAAAALAGWWLLRRNPAAAPSPVPPIPSGADPLTGQYGQQTGQGYPPLYPPRTNYLLNPLITDAPTSVCAAPVRQLQAQSAVPTTTREGAGQAGPPGAWVYRAVVLPTRCDGPVGDGRGRWGNGGA